MPLLPADPLGRARVRELMELIDLYLELPARRLYAEALFGGKVSDEVKEHGAPGADCEASRASRQRARFAPYIAGPELTLADFGAAIHLPLISITTKAIYGADFLEDLPAVRAAPGADGPSGRA